MLKACASPLTLRSSAVCVKGTAAAAVGAAASATLALIAARITLYLTFVCACLINDDASVAALAPPSLPFASVFCCFFCLGPLLFLLLLLLLPCFGCSHTHCRCCRRFASLLILIRIVLARILAPPPPYPLHASSCHALPWPHSFILQRTKRLIRAHFTYCQPELGLT